MISSKARQRSGGFTMVELLVTLAILTSIGGLLLQLVRGSFTLYRDGDQRGDLYATATPVLEMVEEDLRAVDPGPDGRLLLLPDAFGKSGSGFLLRLVRSMPGGEQQHRVLRRAGTAPGASGSYNGEDPGLKSRREIAPPSGLLEVAYALIHEQDDPPSLFTLFRGERAPAHGPGSFFGADGDAMDEGWVRANLRPVATGILGFWILCQSQKTEDWAEEIVIDGRGGDADGLMTWDSTRGLLSSDQFALARGRRSVADPRDDIYPRAVRLVLHVARGGRSDATLRRVVREDHNRIEVNTTDNFPKPHTEDRFIKIGVEWMNVTEHESGEARVQRRRRRSGTRTGIHRAGEPVWVGRAFRKTLTLPAARSWWSTEDR